MISRKVIASISLILLIVGFVLVAGCDQVPSLDPCKKENTVKAPWCPKEIPTPTNPINLTNSSANK